MESFTTVAAVRARFEPCTTRKVLVPTMGALHRGHVRLIELARQAAGEDGLVCVSIFVNPLQFGPDSDFAKYPRHESADNDLCRDAGVDIIFRPSAEEMYCADRSVFVEETSLSETLCGKSRPGHFRGVCTVVTKLFHILSPDAAVFGEKDFQQLAIIRRLVRDLDFSLEIIAVPTVREQDGLACSSRNQYLTTDEKRQAVVLQKSLLAAKQLVEAGGASAADVRAKVHQMVSAAPLARVDYVELVDAETLQPIDSIGANSLLALAIFFGNTRLIDNVRLT
ncbi:MAG: pantoate--beta-alanine ligase [Chthoniobacterales bacterium]